MYRSIRCWRWCYSERMDPVTVTEEFNPIDGQLDGCGVGWDGECECGWEDGAVGVDGYDAAESRLYVHDGQQHLGRIWRVTGSNTSSTFTTGSTAHTGAPQVVLRSVANGATGVPVNGHLVFQFDTPLADRCVNAQTVKVSAGGNAVAGTLSLSTDRTMLTFTPQGLLGASTVYTLSLDGVCDLAGNTLSGATSTFTTRGGGDGGYDGRDGDDRAGARGNERIAEYDGDVHVQ